MKEFIRKYWKTLAFFALAGLIGGFCMGLYLLDSYPEEMVRQILEQGLTPVLVGLVTAVQSCGYGLVLGAVGVILAKKIGLWREERKFEKRPLLAAVIVALIGGLAMILLDLLWFGNHVPAVRDSYLVKPTVVYLLGCVTYGAVIEEVMLRLFFMSLVAFILHRIFQRGKGTPSAGILIAANVISALLFAAGHLPATAVILGLTPVTVLRCFLLNGGIGLLFGWLYRKYGLRYAMVAHGGCHIVSKLIWILFL